MTYHDIDIVARTLYGEARGEYTKIGLAALIAVANVIVNRWKRKGRFGKTLTDVCLKTKQFSCWNSDDPNRSLIQELDLENDPLFQKCQLVTQKVIRGIWPDVTQRSDHYHAISCHPSWARKDKVKLYLGNHVFYHLG